MTWHKIECRCVVDYQHHPLHIISAKHETCVIHKHVYAGNPVHSCDLKFSSLFNLPFYQYIFQFLKFVERVAPIGVYTSGKGSSAAGTTRHTTPPP
jgi:DNA replicative helicase MCM subunit Mcm2 (Cdc46/Mcm family)